MPPRRLAVPLALSGVLLLALAAIAYQTLPGPIPAGLRGPIDPSPTVAPVHWVAEGDRLMAERQFSAAAEAYLAARDATPTDDSATRKLVQLYLSRHRYAEAASEIEQYLQTQPADPWALGQAGEVYRALNRHADAAAAWQRVLEADSANVAAHGGLADLAFAAGEWAAARRHLEAASNAAPADTRVSFYLAMLLSVSDVDRALVLARQTAARPADEWTGRAASLAMDLQSWKDTREPIHRQVLLGMALMRQGAYRLAVGPLEGAVSAFPNYRDGHAYLGHALWAGGDLARAENHLRRSLELDPNYAPARYYMALLRRSQGRFSESADLLESLVLEEPGNSGWWVELARVYDALGNYDVAARAYARAVALDPTRVEYLVEQVSFHSEHAWNAEAALPSANLLAQMQPQNAAVLDLVGWTMHLGRSTAGAKNLLARAEEFDPDYGGAAYHLGRIHAAQGNWEESRNAYARAIENDLTGTFGARAQSELDALEKTHPLTEATPAPSASRG